MTQKNVVIRLKACNFDCAKDSLKVVVSRKESKTHFEKKGRALHQFSYISVFSNGAKALSSKMSLEGPFGQFRHLQREILLFVFSRLSQIFLVFFAFERIETLKSSSGMWTFFRRGETCELANISAQKALTLIRHFFGRNFVEQGECFRTPASKHREEASKLRNAFEKWCEALSSKISPGGPEGPFRHFQRKKVIFRLFRFLWRRKCNSEGSQQNTSPLIVLVLLRNGWISRQNWLNCWSPKIFCGERILNLLFQIQVLRNEF